MRQGAALSIAHIMEQGTGRTQGERQFAYAKAIEIVRGKLGAQQPLRTVAVEVPGRQSPQAGSIPQNFGERAVFAD